MLFVFELFSFRLDKRFQIFFYVPVFDSVLRILQKLEERGFIAKVQIRTADGKNITAYKNLGLDFNLPLHVGKPFSPVEKLELNLLQRKDILQAWKTEYRIEIPRKAVKV